jgi:TRAP-type C4-dicarboxylate transport system substrate-binding protein
MKKIKWILYHQPVDIFIRTAQHFEEEVNRLSGNKFEFEILELKDYENKYKKGQPCDLMTELKNGNIQMSQVYVFGLAMANASDFLALGLPFLFRDHDHASRVFEGEVGDQLLAHLKDTLQIKGLSFTYSGGYKVMASDTPIELVEDFKKLNYHHNSNGLWNDIFQTLGSTRMTDGNYNFRQTTLPRYHADATSEQVYCTDTAHSMYLTTILMNENMWSNFDTDTKEIFKSAAKVVARAERKQSVADAQEIASSPTIYNNHGIQDLLYFSEEEQFKLKTKLTPLIDKWKPYFTPGLVDNILAH